MIALSILITKGGSGAIPEMVAENMASFRSMHPQFEPVLYDLERTREFLKAHFGNDMLTDFDTLRPFAYKADLARYCVIHELGGIYSDVSYFFVRPVEIASDKLSVFRDFTSSTIWDACTGIFAAPARHKAVQKAIELTCANIRNRFYGKTSLCPTGPTLFGKAIALTCEPEDLLVGDSNWIRWPHFYSGRRHCQSFMDSLVAIKRKPTGNGLLDLGIRDGNSYSELWQSRSIYET